MSFSKRQIAQVKRLLTRYGKLGAVSFYRPATRTLDPVEGVYTSVNPQLTPVLSAIMPIKKNLIDGKRILATDTMFLSSPDFEPKISDIAVIDSKEYKIILIDLFRPSAEKIAYRVVCRG